MDHYKKNKNHILNILLISLILFVVHWYFQFYNYDDKLITKILFSKKTEGQLYSYIKLLSTFEFNNSYMDNLIDLNNLPIPFGSLIFHSVFFKLFGELGLIVIDFFGIFLFLYIFYLIFFNFTNTTFALFYSVLLYTLPTFLIFIFGDSMVYLTQLTNDFYSLRVHRPFPASLYFYLSILIIILIQRKPNSRKLYIFFGILLGMQFSSFYYFFLISGLSFFINYLLSNKNNILKNLKKNINNLLLLLSSFVVVSLPFAYFLFTSEPDVLTSSGLFVLTPEKKNYIINYFIDKYLDQRFIILNIIIITIVFFINIKLTKFKILFNTLYIFFISSMIAPILFFAFSNKSGLIYHFSNSIILIAYIFFIIFLFILFFEISNKFIDQKYKTISIVLILLAFISCDYSINLKTSKLEKQIVRSEFNDVTNILNNQLLTNPNLKTLLTFEMSFMNWAVIKKKFDNLNLVYSTLTPRTSEMIEDDLIKAFKFLNLNSSNFRYFLKSENIDGRYYNGNVQKFMYLKYTANSLNRYQDSQDFDKLVHKHIMSTSPMLSKQIVIPNDEMDRLIIKFNKIKNTDFKVPDVIVLNKIDYIHKNISINKSFYCKVYSKKVFELYLKKNLTMKCT